jgi:hypothetical protein
MRILKIVKRAIEQNGYAVGAVFVSLVFFVNPSLELNVKKRNFVLAFFASFLASFA